MINIRIEEPKDIPQVRMINEKAFETLVEANIVDRLRQTCHGVLSLVAEDGDSIVGQILFSPAVIETPEGKNIEGMGLAPMAVLPEKQGRGIGSLLVKRGIEILQERSCLFVIVIGHPKYYPRFGFEKASKYNLVSKWDGVPDEAFMIMIMDQKSLKGVSGVVKYPEEFDEAM